MDALCCWYLPFDVNYLYCFRKIIFEDPAKVKSGEQQQRHQQQKKMYQSTQTHAEHLLGALCVCVHDFFPIQFDFVSYPAPKLCINS